MTWRVARSLDVLLAEINAIAPSRSKASDGSIGDTAHAASASDHNPNSAGVVCARDFTHDPSHGADMGAISRIVASSGHPDLKYVIFNRRIWQDGWQPYYGSDPHTGHMHVSVGRGPDGRSTQPYDDTTPWGVAEEDDVSAEDVWTYDPGRDGVGGVMNQGSDAKTNITVQPGYALQRAWGEAKDAAAGVAAVRAEQAAAAKREAARDARLDALGQQLASLTAAVNALASAPDAVVRAATGQALRDAGAALAEPTQ